jgi:phage FluMu protein Com
MKEPCPQCGKLLIEAGPQAVRCTSCKYRGKKAE